MRKKLTNRLRYVLSTQNGFFIGSAAVLFFSSMCVGFVNSIQNVTAVWSRSIARRVNDVRKHGSGIEYQCYFPKTI